MSLNCFECSCHNYISKYVSSVFQSWLTKYTLVTNIGWERTVGHENRLAFIGVEGAVPGLVHLFTNHREATEEEEDKQTSDILPVVALLISRVAVEEPGREALSRAKALSPLLGAIREPHYIHILSHVATTLSMTLSENEILQLTR